MKKGGRQVKVIEQKYTLLKQIGSGLSCVVYLAEHKKLHHTCAIKCISKKNGSGNTFLKETEFLTNLRSIYVPVLYDYEEDTDYWYLIEEYMAGYSLKDLKQNQGFISQNKLMELSIKICEAILWLHSRKPYPLLYLDLKPEHIILTESGLKLLDFGGAAYLKGRQVSGTVLGTVGFASPEQLQGNGIDIQSDIYSIGAVLYWLMTSETVGNERIYEEISGYSKEWNAMVQKCVKLEKTLRYSSVEELLREICNVQKKNRKRQLEQSLKIAIIGSQHRVGVTHFAIGLCISCKWANRSCLYEEHNDSGAIQEIFHYSKSAKEANGIYDFSKFKAIPKYGKAVQIESQTERMFALDYGHFQKELVKEYEKADCIIIIAGGKEWELQQSKEVIERYRKRKHVYYVLRTGSVLDFRRNVKELAIPAAYHMPEYGNPYSLGKRERHFYEALLGHIQKDMVRSIQRDEKKWNLHNCPWHSRNG